MRVALFGAVLVLAAQAPWLADAAEDARRSSILEARETPGEIHDDAGAGIGVVYTTDTDRFRSMRLRAGALVTYESPYDFTVVGGGGTRYKQGEWTKDRYTLVGALRNVERATGAGVVAIGGVSIVGDHARLIGEGTWNTRLSQTSGVELIGQRDFVETRAGLDSGTMTNFVAGSFDHTVTDRLTLIGLAGAQYFSDDNWRTHLRGRLIYVLAPEEGLGLQVRARAYESSGDGPRPYFNPEHYQRADVGLRLRRSIGHWRVLAAAGAGRERIDYTVENPTRYADARLERTFAGDASIALTFVYQRNSDSERSSGGAYAWRYFRAVALIPF